MTTKPERDLISPEAMQRATNNALVMLVESEVRLKAALLRYGRHLDGCGASSIGKSACTCGFDAACS